MSPVLKKNTYVNKHFACPLQKLGFQFYQEQNIEDGLVSLPAFTGIRISYLHRGISQSKGLLQAGDLLISGYTPYPLYGEVKNFSMASIGLHFTLLYRLVGITPRDCQVPLKITFSDPIHTLLLSLFFTPQEQWEEMSLHGIRCNESSLSKVLMRQMERVDFATRAFHCNFQQTFFEIADQMGISYRQLQRDFKAFLGITPTEYERADRFQRAVKCLKVLPSSQASVVSGYWDQAHMIREFKELSGRTPRQVMQLYDIELPQLHIER